MKAFVIRHSDITRCPIRSWSAEHYNADGTCKCEKKEKEDG